ncbi:MAG: nicotinate phosphoribosyltransferase, partial [Candidatus Asgardarchaeia archaeon]
EKTLRELSDAPVDGYGIGTFVANAPTVDFALDIVEKEGKPLAKRGKLSGSKQVWRCNTCGYREITLFNVTTKTCPKCGSAMEALLKPVIKDGKVVVKLPKVKEIREYVKKQLESVEI